MRRSLALVVVLAALAACATSAPIQWAPVTDYALSITDNPRQQRFDVVLMSKADTPLCLSKEAWPAAGALPAGFDGATLTMSAGTLDLLPTGSAYCPGGCGEVRVEPEQHLQGQIPYKSFGDAAAIAADGTRTLAFQVHPYRCAKK